MRLIDADALLKALRVNEDEWGTPDETWRPESEYAGAIKAAPTIEAEPVKHGWWKKRERFYNSMGDSIRWYECSFCGYLPWTDEHNYCPNCGAKMDGGDEHETD